MPYYTPPARRHASAKRDKKLLPKPVEFVAFGGAVRRPPASIYYNDANVLIFAGICKKCLNCQRAAVFCRRAVRRRYRA